MASLETNSVIEATNHAAAIGDPVARALSNSPSWAWIAMVVTSSVSAVIINQIIERRKNRLRFFKMEKVDYYNIHDAPAVHRGKNYESVRCATYRLKNVSNLDYREVVLHIGFRGGQIIHVQPHSDIIGEDHFKIDFQKQNQITITLPVFNREDVVDLKIEAANCQEIDLLWKYVGSHTGVQITLPELKASLGGTNSPKSSGGSLSNLEIQKTGLWQRFRAWLATKIHPNAGLY